MADFKTHITVSTALGVGYGAVAYAQFGVPAPTCILAGTLCSVSGMLPDLDSDSGVPLRESLSFAAACVPMLCLDRFRHLGWPMETIALAGAGLYLFIRFGLGKMLKKYTVHRGMFHSIPAAAIAGECAFLVCSSGDIYMRAYKACAVVAGFLSHLILDEIWSVKVTGGRIGLKSSSGTAMKLWGESGWANISCYGKMILLGVFVLNDPIWAGVSPEGAELHTLASRIFGEAKKIVPREAVAELENKVTERLTVSNGGMNAPLPQPNSMPMPYGAPPPFQQPQYVPPPQYPQQQYVEPQYAPPPQMPPVDAAQYYNPSPYPPQNYAAPNPAAAAYNGAAQRYGGSEPAAVPYSPPQTYAQPSYAPPVNPPTYTPPYYAPQAGQTYPYDPSRRY